MSRLIRWITSRVAKMLSPEDRAAALGDLAENSVTGWSALGEIAGLVVLKQAQLWMSWRPWVALIGVAGLAGIFLGRLLFGFSVAFGLEIAAYSHYQVFMNDATLGEVILRLSSMLLVSSACSWTAAYALGRVSRPTVWFTVPLLYLMVLDSFPAWLLYMSYLRGSRNPIMILMMNLLPLNGPAIAGFLIPAFMGLRRGLRRTRAAA